MRAVNAFLFSLLAGSAVAQAKEVEMKIPAEGATLAATLFLPQGSGPFPVISVCHGAGPVVRSAHFYRLDADLFTKHGVAVLLYDKRGCGESSGKFDDVPDFNLLAADLLATVRALKERPEINKGKIGVKGLSQGGWIAPLAASKSSDVAFVISVSGPGVSNIEQTTYQRGQILLDQGLPLADVEQVNELRKVIWTYYGTAKGYENAKERWEAARSQPWFQKAGLRGNVTLPALLGSPTYNYYRLSMLDPQSYIPLIKVPVVAIFGANDRYIPVLESIAGWQRAIEKGNLKDATVRVFSNAGHGINVLPGYEPVRVGDAHEDAMVKQLKLVPEYEKFIVEWVLARVKA